MSTTPGHLAGRGRPSPSRSASPVNPSTRSITCAGYGGVTALVFERCDEDTRLVFNRALADASASVSLCRYRTLAPGPGATPRAPAQRSGRAPPPRCRPRRAALVSAVEQPPARDTDLLRSLGIDLDAVRAAVRQTFGDDALEGLGQRRVHQPWQPWRRPQPPVHVAACGSMGVAPRVKQAFEHARHYADEHQRPGSTRPGCCSGWSRSKMPCRTSCFATWALIHPRFDGRCSMQSADVPGTTTLRSSGSAVDVAVVVSLVKRGTEADPASSLRVHHVRTG